LDRRSEAAVAALRDWNFHMTRDQAAPLIFTAWLNNFHRLVFSDDLGGLYEAHAPDPLFDAARLFAGRPGNAPDWCDNGNTPDRETCVTLLSAALADAVASLAVAYGDEQAGWRWGDAHEARFTSRVWSGVPLLDWLLTRTIAVDGGPDTLNRAVSWPSPDGAAFTDGHGPGLRMIVDLAAIDASRFIIATGQSGNPLSPHYDDLIALWRDGQYLSMLEEPAASLRLVPVAP
jgi:penicillin amidase